MVDLKWHLQIFGRSLARRLWAAPSRRKKQQVVRDCAGRYKLRILVETGTYIGDMVEASRSFFREIHSIELDRALCDRAKSRFRRFKHIHIHHGDSGKVLRDILSLISEPCLFWLDAHHSGGITAKGELTTPVVEELKTILAHPIRGHVVLIDDADSFGGGRDYPRLDEIREMARGWAVENVDGIIRITPRISMKCT